MNDVIKIQMNRDKLAVSNKVVRSIEDILSQGKNINNDTNENLKEKTKNNNEPIIIKKNNIINKENKTDEISNINSPSKKSYKNILSIIFHAILGFIVLFDFIHFLFSPDVRNYYLYNINQVHTMHLYL